MKYTLTLLLTLLFPWFSFGDAIVTSRAMQASTIAEVFIEQNAVRVELEIGIRDVPAFRNILPDGLYEKMGKDPVPMAQRLDRFFKEDFVIKADGKILQGRIRQMEPRKRLKRDDITGEPLPNQGEGEDILFTEFIFPTISKPATLSLKPPENEQNFVSATIGMMVYHLALPVMDFRYLSQEEILQLDWEDPWYSRFANKNLRRKYNEPISAFLYAEPFETRVEVIVRPKDIQQWHDLKLKGVEKISVDMQAAIKEQIADFLLTKMELTIDGEKIEPQLQRINFLKRTLKSSIVINPQEELDAISATLGVIYSVPTKALPQESRLTWNLFSPRLEEVRAASTDEAGPMPYRLRPDDNVLVWKNFLTNPTIPSIKAIQPPITQRMIPVPAGTLFCLLISVPLVRTLLRRKGKKVAFVSGVLMTVCAILFYPFLCIPISVPASPVLSNETSTEVVSGLLGNIYTSFDFREEDTIYDALNESLTGDLLTEVYLQTKKSLELQNQGGAQVKVKAVHLETAEFQPMKNGIKARCVWDVMGSVGHWGHIHQRVNRYEADLSIQPIEGQWKISALEILQEERMK
jgi:hypothetical protein